MQVIILDTADAVAQYSAQLVCEQIQRKPRSVLGLATGSTPIKMYQYLIKQYKQKNISFSEVITFNLDEYIGIDSDNPQSYFSFMKRELFDAIDIDFANVHLPTCDLNEDTKKVGSFYEQEISASGGIDLQVLGIGRNGHIGFNEPTSSLSSKTRVKTLTSTTIDDNSRLFKTNEFQPHLAMTMGIGTILNVNSIILLATGEQKARAIYDAIEGPLTAICPASALQLHENTTFIIDKAAASMLQHSDYYHWVFEQNRSLAKMASNLGTFS
jgi:glucosamine-6-phosphate deaminase